MPLLSVGLWLQDKAERCWICSAKDHCTRASVNFALQRSLVSLWAQGEEMGKDVRVATMRLPRTSFSIMGGKAGAAAAKVLTGNDATISTSTPEASHQSCRKVMVEGSAKPDKTVELLSEATQLLKSLRIEPKLHVMQISGLNQADDEMILLDSGATHALRPAHDEGEWQLGEPTSVQLADGVTEMFRIKKGTKILLSNPSSPSRSTIIPMGGLTDLDFELKWTNGQCQLRDDNGVEVQVTIRYGCPMISRTDAERILQWLDAELLDRHLVDTEEQRLFGMVVAHKESKYANTLLSSKLTGRGPCKSTHKTSVDSVEHVCSQNL